MDTDTLHQQQLTKQPQQGNQQRLRVPLRMALAALRFSAIALVVGLLGSLAAILVMGTLRLTLGTPTLPELLGDRILPTLSANEFVALLVRFAPNSKTAPLGLTLLGQFFVGIVLGPAFSLAAGKALRVRRFWPGRRAWNATRSRSGQPIGAASSISPPCASRRSRREAAACRPPACPGS